MAIQQKLLVPSSINIQQMLAALGYTEQYINTHQDKWHYVLHKILEQPLFDSSIEAGGYSPLHLDTLREVVGRRYADTILKELEAQGIIQCDFIKVYGEQGSKAYGYRIHPELASKSKLHPVLNPVFDKKLRSAAYRYKQKWSKSTPWKNLMQLGIRDQDADAFVNAKLETSLMMLQEYEDVLELVIDKNNAETVLDVYRKVYKSYSEKEDRFKEKNTKKGSSFPFSSLYSLIPVQAMEKALQMTNNQGVAMKKYLHSLFVNKHDAEEKSIWKIANQKLFFEQPDPSSRLFTNLSNLSGELRQFLFHKRYLGTLVNLDIRNSQPYLLSLLLMDKYAGQPVPASVQKYIELTAAGGFYEHVMGLMGIDPAAITKRSRREFKETFFAKIFFCKPYYSRRTPEGKVFRRCFKEVADLMDTFKAGGHEQLAITMQRREAEIILQVVGSALHHRGIWYATIHDSVVVREEHEEVAKKIILDSFLTAVGVAPTVNPEYLSAEGNVVRAEVGQEEAALLSRSEELLSEVVGEDKFEFSTLTLLDNYTSVGGDCFFDD